MLPDNEHLQQKAIVLILAISILLHPLAPLLIKANKSTPGKNYETNVCLFYLPDVLYDHLAFVQLGHLLFLSSIKKKLLDESPNV
jgi:hypothetical protein